MKSWRRDAVAGVSSGITSVPDAMATAVLAGLNPAAGLHAAVVGPAVGALFTSSVFMNVFTTSSLAVTTREALRGRGAEAKVLATLTVLVGAFQLAAALARVGWITRFVSNAVMRGFLTGIGILTVLGQLGDLTGYASRAATGPLRAWDTLLHAHEVEFHPLVIGLATIGAMVALSRTRLQQLSTLVALVVGTVLVPLLGWPDVPSVGDQFHIGRSFPAPALPDLALVPSLLIPALGLAIIGLVQGTGVSESNPNPDGRPPDPSRDFLGQGIANAVSGVLRGMPVGGSISGTATIVNAGATSRWANLIAAATVLVAIAALGPVVELIPSSALAGVLVVIGARTIDFAKTALVLKTTWAAGAAMGLTLVATLVSPLQVAVLVGVVTSVVLHLVRSMHQLRLREMVVTSKGIEERPPPRELSDDAVAILMPYGSLFFAGARAFEEQLPRVGAARRPVVILGLRGRPEAGSTFIEVLRRYSHALQAAGGRLMLVGVEPNVMTQLRRTRALAEIGEHNVFPTTRVFGEAFLAASAAAREWLARPAHQAT